MKKYLITFTFAFLTCLSAISQNTIVYNPENKAYFGFRIGGEIALPGNISVGNNNLDVFKNGWGLEVGAVYSVPIVANFYIEPGLKFYYNTYPINDRWANHNGDVSFRKTGMRVPVMAGYHFDFAHELKLYVFTGPELEIGFSAREYFKENSSY